MNDERIAGQDLPQLLDLLTNAVTTLDAAGVDSYGDVYLHVTARRDGHSFGKLSIEGGRLSLETNEPGIRVPPYVQSDHDGNRRALLLADLCYIMWHWRWDGNDVADYLGCGPTLLDRWIQQSQGPDVPVLPEAVAQRVRRVAVLEHHRMILGVPDVEAPDWIRLPRLAFGNRSILDLLCCDGEVGFRRIEIWLLNGVAAVAATVH